MPKPATMEPPHVGCYGSGEILRCALNVFISLVILGSTLGTYGQGTVNFNTVILGVNAPVYDDAGHGGYLLGSTNYGPGAQGTNWFAQLYAAAGTGVQSAALVPVGQPVNFRSGANAGYVQTSGTATLGWSVNPVIAIPFLSPGGPATMQLRVWWGGGTQIVNYEAAMVSSNPNSRWGASPLLCLAATGDPTASPPTTPADLIGLLYYSIGEIQPARPPVITVQPQSEVAFVGANVFLNVAAIGMQPMSYQWSYDGTSILGATTALLVLANVQPADAGSYAVRITNADGSATSSNAVVTVGPPPPCATPPVGLVSWWRAETGADDFVGGNHGTFLNGAGLGLGKVGHAFDLGGNNYQSVVIPNSDTLNPRSSFSIEGWIFPRIGGVLDLFTKWESLKLSYAFGTHSRGLFFAVCDEAHQSDLPFYWYEVNNVLTLNAWNHVAAVYDQPNGTRHLYVNGVQVGARTNLPITVLRGTAQVRIEANGFNGLIDELSFYSVALSGNDIQAIYAAGSVGKCEPVPAPPAITVQPTSLRVTQWTAATFWVEAGGHPFPSYQWLFNGEVIPDATSGAYSLNAALPGDAGNYSVIVSNALGSVTSLNAVLTVLTFPPEITNQPADLTLRVGRTANFSVGARGTPPLSYQWFFNSSPLDGQTGTALALTNVQLNQAGAYFVTVTNAYGSAASSNAQLTVLPPPACAPVPTGAVAWWRAEDNTAPPRRYQKGANEAAYIAKISLQSATILGGGTAAIAALDSVSHNSATFVSNDPPSVSSIKGKVGNAFQFGSGGYGYLTAPGSDELDVGAGDGLTVEGWIKPDSDYFTQPVVEWNDGRGNIGAGLMLRSSLRPGALEAWFADTNRSPARIVRLLATNATVTTGNWSHVALTFDKASGMAAIYCNGIPLAQTNLGSFRPQTRAPVYLGYRRSGTYSNRWYRGGLDEVTIYNRALSATELQAIVAADETGKCKEPPFFVTQPASPRVNVGTDTQFNVVASGNPMLRYQWFKKGTPLSDATGTSLALTNVQDAQAGEYSVRVTNWFGQVISSNALLTVNHAPVADASATIPVVISRDNSNATVVLNGSRSSDPDNDPLQYHWVQAGTANVLATGMVAVVPLPLGTNAITLQVDDGLALNTQNLTVEVITPRQATERLWWRVLVQSPRPQPLTASLLTVMASLGRENATAAMNQLQAFQNKVRAQLGPVDAVLAEQLILAAEEVIGSLSGGSGREHVRFTAIHRQANGKTRLHFTGRHGPLYLVEVSTDLVHWEKIGVAADNGDGSFEFEDSNATRMPTRFYRIVSP